MKKINKFFLSLGIAASAFGLSSCVGDLDLQPRDPSENTDVSNDMDRVFADLYLQFATYGANGDSPVSGFDGGMAAFQRAMFIAEEIPTDEASWLWDPADYGLPYNGGLFNPNQGCLYGFYSRLMINITLCNQFIQSVDNGTFNLDAEGQKRAEEYKLQAKALWGACYYYMLSFYNNVPYADYTTPVGAMPAQLPRKEVYDRVTSELEATLAAFGSDYQTKYGFAGPEMLEAVLAKIYLNAEVFSGTPAWDKCYAHCKNIIDKLGKGGYYGNGLARAYGALFGANNDIYALGNPGSEVNEIIWTIAGNEVELTGFSGANFLTAGWIGTNGVTQTMGVPTQVEEDNNKVFENADGEPQFYTYYEDDEKFQVAQRQYDDVISDKKIAYMVVISETINGVHYSFDPAQQAYIAQDWYNCGNGWKCMVGRKSFIRKFEWDDVNMSVSADRRVANWQTSKNGFSVENISLVGDDWGNNGYLCPKYTNWAYNEDGTINKDLSPKNTSSTAGDYAVIRLAEIYLTAAEAILNGGGGTQAEALQYVNWIRERAYGDAPGATDHHWLTLSMQDLRDERCRELYQENVRRTDLIRWNQWCTGYTWEWKGGTSQSGTNLPE
ncbi:MAG: RagB/SusD family nutrient uptake outer membrane protein, partial [Muribaculaceae bacterium]|nr:RagB/SusD family nutrient uptake outer membrane protein [Muribaculaceae bacterium]